MKYSSQSHGSDEQRRMETRAKHPRCPISAGTLQGTIFKNRDRAILLFYEASWRTEKVGGLLGHQAPPMGVPAKHSSSQDSTRSIRCASSTEKCLPCRGEKAAAALLLLQRQHLPHVKHKLTSSPDTCASRTQTHRELSYRFVLQLLQEVLSWMPCYFQDLGQLIQVWQAVLKITF